MNIFVEENTVRGKLNFGNFSQIFLKILPKSTKLHRFTSLFFIFRRFFDNMDRSQFKKLACPRGRDLSIPV